MENTTQPALHDTAMFAKTILKSWTLQVSRIDDFLTGVSNEVLQGDTAPGRNSGAYLIGHLTAVSDGLFPLLGFGPKLYPQLEKTFISSPDKSGLEFPSVDELRKYWKDVNDRLIQHFNGMDSEEWLSRHEAVSEADFAKEPFRNKLNVLINRTAHMSYHLGQLAYLKARKA